jgi:hypothetical protein
MSWSPAKRERASIAVASSHSLVTEGLIGAVVDREPRAVRQPRSGESLLPQDLKHFGVHRDQVDRLRIEVKIKKLAESS